MSVSSGSTTRQTSPNFLTWRLHTYELAKVKGQCLYKGLCFLPACGCKRIHSITQDGCPHSSVSCNEDGNGILNCVNDCLSPCLEEFSQLLPSSWLNLERRQYKIYAVRSTFVSTKIMHLFVSVFSFIYSVASVSYTRMCMRWEFAQVPC